MTPLSKIRRGMRKFSRAEEGAAAVEFAIVGSLFVVLALAILQFGWALQVRNELALVADEVARSVMIDPDKTDKELSADVKAKLSRYDADRLSVATGNERLGSMTIRTLHIRYGFAIAIPGLPSERLALSVSRRIPTY